MRIIMLLIAFTLVFCANGFCHNPSGITVTFREGGIEVAVSHSVANPATHYVKRIEVKVNGEKAGEEDFTAQGDDMSQKAGFELPALKKGDTVEIAAYCSKYGDVAKTVTVE